MNLTLLTTEEKDANEFVRSVAYAVESAETLSKSLNLAMRLWQLPDDRLTALLNRAGAANVQQLLQLVQGLGTVLNVALPAVGSKAAPVVVAPPREFTVAPDGVITLTPLPAP